MSEPKPSIDGFVPRRRTTPESQAVSGLSRKLDHEPGLQRSQAETDHQHLSGVSTSGNLRSDIDTSLREIDDEQAGTKKHRKQFINKRKLIKRIVIALLIIGVLIGGFLGVKALLAASNIFKGNLFGLVQAKPLKKDANGRSNILILGTSGSVDDQSHDGADLTDSMIVLSVDQEKKDAYMVSLPRDLWVKYGQACTAGLEGKLNALFECYDDGNEAGAKALSSKAGEITGLDIQYYVHVNWAVLINAVDAVGGVDVTIESNPKGEELLDRNFDWTCNYRCYFVRYKDGERVHLDGEHALALARARGATAPNSGLAAGNFDREKNQQKVIKALREKALSAGTLADIGKVTSLIDALGANIKTNFATEEFQTLMGLGRDIPSDKVISIALNKTGEEVVATGDIGGQSVVRAVKGIYDYSGIAAYIKKQMSSDPATREGAMIGVYNGSDAAGIAKKTADDLESKGLTIGDYGNVTVAGEYQAYEIYDLTNGEMPATKAKLEQIYGTKVQTGRPPFATTGLDFMIIVGQAPRASGETQ